MRIHIVYKKDPSRVSTPWSIGNRLFDYFSKRYEVIYHSPSRDIIEAPKVGDILLGHPSWNPTGVFSRLVRMQGWKKKVAIHPICPVDLASYAHLASEVAHCDAFLAITGPVWIDRLPKTCFRSWADKLTHLNLAVDTTELPFVKTRSQSTNRKFLFIGNNTPFKNITFLDSLAKSMPEVEFHRIGPYQRRYRYLKQHGKLELNDTTVLEFLGQFDFMITMSNSDANPTTILEAMCLGLIPVAPLGSGYYEENGVQLISGSSLDEAKSKIWELINIPERQLEELRESNLIRVKRDYTWDVFLSKVEKTLLSSVAEDFTLPHKERVLCLLHRLSSYRSPLKYSRLPRAVFDLTTTSRLKGE